MPTVKLTDRLLRNLKTEKTGSSSGTKVFLGTSG